MKAIVTGANGTVGRALTAHLEGNGTTVVRWNRNEVPIDDYHQMEAFVRKTNPDVLFHLAIASQPTGRENEGWLVNYHWPSEIAWITAQLNVRMIFTSTVMVFSNDAKGPFTRASVPDSSEGYGGDKRQAEERVRYQNPDAVIARLGWQIGEAAGSNNMVDFLYQQQQEHGVIGASTRWLPACSFLTDTAQVLTSLIDKPADIYLLDANTPGWNFYEIATALNAHHGNPWNIVANEDFVYDQRMMDDRVNMPDLSTRLPDLPAK